MYQYIRLWLLFFNLILSAFVVLPIFYPGHCLQAVWHRLQSQPSIPDKASRCYAKDNGQRKGGSRLIAHSLSIPSLHYILLCLSSLDCEAIAKPLPDQILLHYYITKGVRGYVWRIAKKIYFDDCLHIPIFFPYFVLLSSATIVGCILLILNM